MRETEKKYLKWYQKIAYGAGDLASNTSYGLVSSFVLSVRYNGIKHRNHRNIDVSI